MAHMMKALTDPFRALLELAFAALCVALMLLWRRR